MENLEIRQAIKSARLMQYEVAGKIGISEYTLCKWLRKELPNERKAQILDAIAALKAGEAHA